MIAGHIVTCKGEGDQWVVDKLVEDIADWGLTDIVFQTDGESAIVKVMEMIINTT